MNVEHAFATRYESIEAFGLANEVLRPLGFTLQDGNPNKTQQWQRPGNASARSVTARPQTLRMEHDRGRVTCKMSMEIAGKRIVPGQKLLLSYAKSLEILLAERKDPKTAASHARGVMRGVRAAEVKSVLTKCAAIIVLLAGAAFAIKFSTDRIGVMKGANKTPKLTVQSTGGGPALPPPPAAPAAPADPRIQVTVKPADPNAAKKHTAPQITVRRSSDATSPKTGE